MVTFFARDTDYIEKLNELAGSAGGAVTNPMTTEGDLIVGGPSGAPDRIAAGATPGYVLTSTGAGSAPSWQATAASGATVTVSTSAPGSPSAGDLWWKSDEGRLKVYYNDGTSTQWVDAFALPEAGPVRGLSPLTTAGDLIVGGTAGAETRLAAGATSGHILTSTGSGSAPSWQAAAGGGSGSITASGYTMNTARLLGRTTGSSGAVEEMTVGSGLTLSAGTLTASGGSGTPAGTSFPGSPSSGQQFFRTDLGLECYYDGTRWLTKNELSLGLVDVRAQVTANSSILFATPDFSQAGMYITRFIASHYQNGTPSDGSNYWTAQLVYAVATLTATAFGGTYNTSTNASGNFARFSAVVNTSLPSTAMLLQVQYTKTGSPAGFYPAGVALFYRLIVT